MVTTALIVEIVDRADGTRSAYTFNKSPVRVGRSPLNDLPLERSFVSHCHGLIHFDRQRCEFTDLGSTNGTYLNDRRLARNEPVVLGGGKELRIGTLVLSARHGVEAVASARGTYAFRRSDLHGAKATDAQRGIPSATPSVASRAEQPKHALTAALRGAFPGVLLVGAEERRVERLLEALQRFAEAFLELRRGQQRLARDLSLPEARFEVGTRHDAMELLSLLIDPGTSGEPLDELSRAHADLMLHQVALINAARAGAQALLAELAPDAMVPAQRGPLVWASRLLGRDARWEAFQRRHGELGEETALSSVLFGKAFRRAYAATVGRSEAEARAIPDRGGQP